MRFKCTSRLIDILVPADHRVKIKVNEKRYKYFDLLRQKPKKKNCGT